MKPCTEASLSYSDLWVEKLWRALFSGEIPSLMSPGQIRRERRDRKLVRQLEMQSLLDTERELNAVRQGEKQLDPLGRLVDTPSIGRYSTHQVIESPVGGGLDDIVQPNVSTIMAQAVQAAHVQVLEQNLNLMKLALLAEAEIYLAKPRPVSPKPIAAEWLMAWRKAAQDIYSPQLQQVYVAALISELAKPGALCIAALSTLAKMSHDDLDMLSMIAKYRLGGFIFNASDGYFGTDFHTTMLDTMDDLGLVSGVGFDPYLLKLSSSQRESFVHRFLCGNRALVVEHESPNFQCQIPILRLKRQCVQLCQLLSVEADIAYLHDLARYLKAQGATVTLGNIDHSSGHFIKKIQL